MEDDADRVERTAGSEQRQGAARQRLHNSVVGDHAAPAQNEAERDRQPIEPAREKKLQRDADGRGGPYPDEQAHGSKAVLQLNQKWRVGAGDQQVDRGMIEAAQQPFPRRYRPEIIGGGKTEYR